MRVFQQALKTFCVKSIYGVLKDWKHKHLDLNVTQQTLLCQWKYIDVAYKYHVTNFNNMLYIRIKTNLSCFLTGKKCKVSYYVMSKSFPLLFFKGLTEDFHKLVQFFSMTAQKFSHILNIPQIVCCRNQTYLFY